MTLMSLQTLALSHHHCGCGCAQDRCITMGSFLLEFTKVDSLQYSGKRFIRDIFELLSLVNVSLYLINDNLCFRQTPSSHIPFSVKCVCNSRMLSFGVLSHCIILLAMLSHFISFLSKTAFRISFCLFFSSHAACKNTNLSL